jgi:hypothetical protein
MRFLDASKLYLKTPLKSTIYSYPTSCDDYGNYGSYEAAQIPYFAVQDRLKPSQDTSILGLYEPKEEVIPQPLQK